MQAIGLALACLSFDFFGTCMDDSSEDLSTIQVSLLLRGVCTNCTYGGTMRFGSTAKVLLKCKLKYYRISECGGSAFQLS